jgi:hypothetical protein
MMPDGITGLERAKQMAITEYIQNVDCAVLNTVFENTVSTVNKTSK